MFCVYETESTRFVRIIRNGYWQDALYQTQGAANAALHRFNKSGKYDGIQLAVAELGYFSKHIEKTRKTRNILNPAAGEIEIPVNTPLCCDPGSETYHNM